MQTLTDPDSEKLSPIVVSRQPHAADTTDTTSRLAAVRDRWLLGILVAAILLRLLYILALDPAPTFSGSDVGWYLEVGHSLVTGTQEHPVPTGPVFLVYVGLIQLAFPADSLRAIRLLNVVWHVLLLFSVYRITARTLHVGVARLTGLALAISPAFVVEAGAPLTESLFLGLFFAALALLMAVVEQRDQERGEKATAGHRRVMMAGVLLGLAALTRAVVLAFPVVAVAYLVRQRGWRAGLRLGATLSLGFALTVATWSLYNVLRWNRLVIGAEGLGSFMWMGATGITDPYEIDAALGVQRDSQVQRDSVVVGGFLDTLRRDLPGWLGTRLSNLGGAVLQPHNTVHFPGPGLKEGARDWLAHDRSLAGLWRLTQAEAFWPKLALYVFHFWALICGALGLLGQARRCFWRLLPLYGVVLYFGAVHFVLFANPRYLFPAEPVLYVFAACATAGIAGVFRRRAGAPTTPPIPPASPAA